MADFEIGDKVKAKVESTDFSMYGCWEIRGKVHSKEDGVINIETADGDVYWAELDSVEKDEGS